MEAPPGSRTASGAVGRPVTASAILSSNGIPHRTPAGADNPADLVRRMGRWRRLRESGRMDMDPESGSASTTVRTTAAWRAAGERGDVEAAGRCLAPGIEVVSPLTAQFRFCGPHQVQDMLAAAFEVISDIRYHTEVGDDVTRALFYRGRCGREQFEEAQLLRFDGVSQLIGPAKHLCSSASEAVSDAQPATSSPR